MEKLKSVVFVGNSKNVQNLGYKVDQADYVVRFNNFKTESFEELVGSKWDCCARRSCDDVSLHKLSNHQWILNCITYCDLSVGMSEVAKKLSYYYKDKIVNVPILQCRQYGVDAGLDQPVERCSIGLIAISWFHRNRERLGLGSFYLHGFDWFKCAEHLTGPKPKDPQNHAWEKERSYVLSLPNVYLLTEDTEF
jgi:hypothetical protein